MNLINIIGKSLGSFSTKVGTTVASEIVKQKFKNNNEEKLITKEDLINLANKICFVIILTSYSYALFNVDNPEKRATPLIFAYTVLAVTPDREKTK